MPDTTNEKVIALREQVILAMPWYDEFDPDYTELDAILAAAISHSESCSDACPCYELGKDRAFEAIDGF